jgi:hypothetical protein
MAKTQFEALIEHIINDEEEAARELLHDIVVQTSRQIYNEMAAEDEHEEENEDEEKVDEASFDEAGGDMSDDMIDDVEADEEGMSMDDAGDELGDEMGMDDEGDMEAGEEGEDELEDRVVDLEAALDELKAEFDSLMSQEAGEEEHSDMDMGGDDMEMDMGSDDMDMPKEGMVREYVEKVKAPSNTEGQTVGTGSSDKPSVNSKSIVDNMKNDMGGTVKNLVQGGETSSKSVSKPKDVEYASRNVNQVGGNKGASDFYKTKAKAPSKEEAGVNDKSPLAKG